MCIFSSEAAVEKTIIAAWKQNDRHFMAYQNKVVSKTANVMMLPIPTGGEFTFHDTTNYKDFLTEIGKAVFDDEMKGSRGMKSIELTFQRIGQYQIAQVKSKKVKSTLEQLKQPIPIWLDKMLESYKGWSWLFCIMDANTSMDSQPILVEFDSLFPNELYFAMMDVHGNDEVSEFAKRDHILAIGAETIDNPVISSEKLNNFTFPNLQFSGAVITNRTENGDAFAHPTTPGRYRLRYQNLYQIANTNQ